MATVLTFSRLLVNLAQPLECLQLLEAAPSEIKSGSYGNL